MAASRTGTIGFAGRAELVDRAREAVVRAWPSIIAGAVLLVLLLRLAWEAGGYFPAAYVGAGAVALLVLGVLLIVRPPHYSLSTSALVALAALGGFAVWTGLSAAWSPLPDTAVEDAQRALTYLGIFGLGLVAAGSGRLSTHVVWGCFLLTFVVVGAGLLSRLYPDVLATSLIPGGPGEYRLDYPLLYWNAFGGMAGMGAVLGLGLAADLRSPVTLRAVAAGASVLMVVALYMSLSRGSWLALGIGLAVVSVLGAYRGSLAFTLLVTGAGSALAIFVLTRYGGLVDAPFEGSGQLAEGRAYGLELIVIASAVGAAQGVVARLRAWPELIAALRRVVRPILIVLGGIAVLAALVVYTTREARIEGEAAQRLQSVEKFADRQWADFLQPGAVGEAGRERLATARGTRADLYRVAFNGFADHPLRGDGAGGFETRFIRERSVGERVRDAHSLYLETLSELGLVGFALLATLVGAVIVAALRARLRPTSLSRGQAAAALSACLVWAVHAGVDWDWQIPAFTGTALVLAAAFFPHGRRRVDLRGRR